MKARIVRGAIAQIYKRPKPIIEDGTKQPMQVWQDTARMEGWGYVEYSEVTPDSKYYSRGVFTDEITGSTAVRTYAGEPRDVTPMKFRMLDEVAQHAKSLMDSVVNEYSVAEMTEWETKRKEAEAYVSDSAAPTPVLDAEIAAIGGDRVDYILKVKAKADRWIPFRVGVIAARSNKTLEISALSTLDEVIAYENHSIQETRYIPNDDGTPSAEMEINTRAVSKVTQHGWPSLISDPFLVSVTDV